MAKLLKNLKVTEVSILTGDKLPANGESVIIKDAGGFEIIAKADKCIDGLVYCTVVKDDFDTDDEKPLDKKTIQKAAHDFMKNSRTIDENHDHKALNDIHVVESYIDENGDWKAVLDVSENAEMLTKAAKGEITGVSIYGKAEKVEKAGAEFSSKNKGILKQAYELLSSFFQSENNDKIEKGFKENIAMQDWWKISDAFSSAMRDVMNDEKITDKSSALKKQADEFKAYLDSVVLKNPELEMAIKKNEITKNQEEGTEMPITKDELKAMLAEIEADKKAPETPGVNAELETMKSTVKTLTETVENQAKTIEEIAKARKTESETPTGKVTKEMIFKCDDPKKQAEMLEIFKSQKKGE